VLVASQEVWFNDASLSGPRSAKKREVGHIQCHNESTVTACLPNLSGKCPYNHQQAKKAKPDSE
jgi:hypothetical protein